MSRVKKLRKEKNLTQEELAQELGVTRQMISAIERGANPGIELLKHLALYFEVSCDAILGVETTSTA